MAKKFLLVFISVLGFSAFWLVLNFRLFVDRIDISSLTGEFDSLAKKAIFHGQEFNVTAPAVQQAIDFESGSKTVLGESATRKRIEVDLTNQRLYAFEDDKLVYNFLISSGKWGLTPTGTFKIWVKLRYTKMEGGSKAINTYYYLPNVPFVMFFSNDQVPRWRGFGLHGTYWHNNFGHPMSHGCVNMKTEEVAQLYYWAMPDLQGKPSVWASDDNPGTEVIIYGQTPES